MIQMPHARIVLAVALPALMAFAATAAAADNTSEASDASIASTAPIHPAAFVLLGLGLVAIAVFRSKFGHDDNSRH